MTQRYQWPIDIRLQRVRVLQIEARHFEDFVRLERDAAVTRYTRGASQLSDAAYNAAIEAELARPTGVLVIEDIESGVFVGRCGFSEDTANNVEVYCVLSVQWQRKKIGPEVTSYLAEYVEADGKIPVAYIEPDNTPALACMVSLGFVPIENNALLPDNRKKLAFARLPPPK